MKRKIETAVADGQARAKQREIQRNDQYREQFATSIQHISAALLLFSSVTEEVDLRSRVWVDRYGNALLTLQAAVTEAKALDPPPEFKEVTETYLTAVDALQKSLDAQYAFGKDGDSSHISDSGQYMRIAYDILQGYMFTEYMSPGRTQPLGQVGPLVSADLMTDVTSSTSTHGREGTSNSDPLSGSPSLSSTDSVNLAGTGDTLTQQFHLERGLALFTIAAPVARGNFAVKLLTADGDYIDLLANTTDAFSGTAGVAIEKTDDYVLNIDGSGRRWTVRIDQPTDPVSVPRPYQFSGTGVAVTPFFHLDGGLARFQIHSAGSTDNFSVVLMSAKGEYIDLLANSTESYDGSKGVDISEPGVYVAFVSAGRRSGTCQQD
ncbi:MAG: hypothetical protein DIJKHBIC_04355 [Thermoanaerobaculia bacterium]|nr:hypothetical protein [Thermoanaerobaculia bacterium]